MVYHVLKSQELDRSVLELGRERVARTFADFDTVWVSFSGGKDSTACLNLALEEAQRIKRLPLDVVFFDEEAIPYQTEDYVRRTAARPGVRMHWFATPLKHRNACSRSSPYWYPWAPEAKELWCRPLPPEALTEHPRFPKEIERRINQIDFAEVLFAEPAKYGRVASIMGIRAAESLTRLRAVSRREHDNWLIQQTPLYAKSYPIYDWRTEDVWSAPAILGWDYNRAYDIMNAAGITPNQQRCSPAFGEEPLEKLWSYPICFPELWEKMCARVPGANTAVRYALTDVYARGRQEFKVRTVTEAKAEIARYLNMFPAKIRAPLAQRINMFIRLHKGVTSDPILLNSAHPISGISWTFLLKLAQRGDFKQRKIPPTGKDTREKRRIAYEAERQGAGAERAREPAGREDRVGEP